MLDFMMVSVRSPKRGIVEIYPKFIVKGASKDLMIRGRDFYAVWDDESGLWSTDENTAINLIDRELDIFYDQHRSEYSGDSVKVMHMWDSDSGSIDRWHRYCQKQMRDNYRQLDEKLIFSDTVTKRTDYASKRLSYSLIPAETPNYTKLSTTLYSEEELHKLEWAIGSIITGDAKKIQKFEVLYGPAGAGKGTMLDIIAQLFEGYHCSFEAKTLGSANASFALEQFKSNPLVAIDFDGQLDRIEDNTRLNALVSHEEMTVNEKFKATYTSKFKCFLFMGTNRPVKITDAKSGLIRRLIDVYPSGNKIPLKEYKRAIEGVKFELGGIACHCRDVYLEDPDAYEGYIPVNMLGESNDFYNFVESYHDIFASQEYTTLKQAWMLYKEYCEEAKVSYPYPMRAFKNELKNYFESFHERLILDNGDRPYNCYTGFKMNFDKVKKSKSKSSDNDDIWLSFDYNSSAFDLIAKDYPAQYANAEGSPSKKWQNNTTLLGELKTDRLHYVKVPTEHIVIDFDIRDENGNKSLQKNIEAAAKWPPTYAELSKSGQGIHLHYIYTGDPTKLANLYDENIEVKVFNGNSSLRRKLTLCNNLTIAKISSGLPQKGDNNVTNFEGIKNNKALHNCIKSRILKSKDKDNPNRLSTNQTMHLIKQDLDEAYASNVKYDVSDMRTAIVEFAAGSTNHSTECIKLVSQMKFKSPEVLDDDILDEPQIEPKDPTKIIYDVEVFPNLLLINWMRVNDELVKEIADKYAKEKSHKKKRALMKELLERNNEPVIRMINPTPQEVEQLIEHNLIGFNCRRYDNHILYARAMGYSNEQLFNLSQKIIDKNEQRNAFFRDAYNISLTDIYDYSSDKKSLKKWEIELGIKHLELGLPWDKPVPKELWPKVAEYCDNDVLSTLAVWCATQADFLAREILADVAGGTVNDTTNTLTTRLIFGNNRSPQSEFNYRFLGDKPKGPSFTYKEVTEYALGKSKKPEGQVWFPGYTFIDKISSYRDVPDVGEGGYVFSVPGTYGYSKTFDITSEHPHSALAENLFGTYTENFRDLVQTRVRIKKKDFESAAKLFGGKLSKYLTDPDLAKNLAQALKIAINSVYGLTAAKFENAFRDPRNVDNIVAKRGALFMIDLRNAVQELGYKVIHCKTDSIKIVNPDEFIENFINKFGECYGYSFEVEDVWDRICLIDKAQYIGLTVDGEWKATGAAFQHPYVYKTLFTHEEIEYEDLCETKAVSKGAIYIDMEDGKDFTFIGRVGQFVPVTYGGGILYRVDNGKNYAVSDTKGYRWLDASDKHIIDSIIDMSYYEDLVRSARGHIITLGNIDDFLDTSKPYVYEVPDSGEVPLELPEVFTKMAS